MARFLVPGMSSLLFSGPYTRLEKMLVTTSEYHSCSFTSITSTLPCCCGSQMSWLRRTSNCFLAMAACTVCCGTMGGRMQESHIQVRLSSNNLSPLSSLCGVYSNRGLCSISEKQPRATATKSILYWESTRLPWPSIQKEFFLCLDLVYGSCMKHCQPKRQNFP